MKVAPIPDNEEQRLKELRALQILDTPIEERFERITRLVCRLLDVPISAISLVDEDRQWFKSVRGLSASQTDRDVAFCAHAILEDDALVVEDATTDSRFADNPLVVDDPGIRFYAGYPLTVGDGIRLGTLCAIDRAARKFSEDEHEILRDLAEMVKSELQSLTLTDAHHGLIAELKQAERAALIDPLSRLWNRAGGEELLRREWEAASRTKSAIALAMIDIDHFKRVNDNFGHAVGDEVIKQFAETILGAFRPYDIVCRWGGEEFLVILPNCNHASLDEILNRLITAIRTTVCETDSGPIAATASMGATSVNPPSPDNPAHYIKIADEYLYKAKEQGRDRYLIGP